MRGRTFALSQKELQRVSVIFNCVRDMACANRGRPSPRRLPLRIPLRSDEPLTIVILLPSLSDGHPVCTIRESHDFHSI